MKSKTYHIWLKERRPRDLLNRASATLTVRSGRLVTQADTLTEVLKTWEEVQRLPAPLPELVAAWEAQTKGDKSGRLVELPY